MSSDSAQLLSMGFSAAKVEYALLKSNNAGLQPALDFLIEHADDAEPTAEQIAAAKSTPTTAKHDEDEEGAPGGAAEAKSLKCLQCGKVFRNNALASYHGEKSGHDQFEESTEEIKPLTEAEKVAKLEMLKEKMQEKKKVNAKREAEEAKVNESIRRKGGIDQSQIKADMELKEANKAALQRVKDKKDDLAAKNAVRLQIIADKAARAERNAREKALRDGTPLPLSAADQASSSTSSVSAVKAASSTSSSATAGGMVRLQIKLPSGRNAPPLILTMEADKTLQDLVDYAFQKSGIAGLRAQDFSCAFPRKTYTNADAEKTLAKLGLAPSASLSIADDLA